mmetsp:Transcript_47938/g.118682  ORF Transcript_47938/g.118682 Transcript_47938/m.118682 type:complete len:86 (-) Transcript_47938:1068-1325(-)
MGYVAKFEVHDSAANRSSKVTVSGVRRANMRSSRAHTTPRASRARPRSHAPSERLRAADCKWARLNMKALSDEEPTWLHKCTSST